MGLALRPPHVGVTCCRSRYRATRLLENELKVLSDSYDALVAQNPNTPQIFFAVALYNENQAVFKSVRGGMGARVLLASHAVFPL